VQLAIPLNLAFCGLWSFHTHTPQHQNRSPAITVAMHAPPHPLFINQKQKASKKAVLEFLGVLKQFQLPTSCCRQDIHPIKLKFSFNSDSTIENLPQEDSVEKFQKLFQQKIADSGAAAALAVRARVVTQSRI
jgi:hypothetical protein